MEIEFTTEIEREPYHGWHWVRYLDSKLVGDLPMDGEWLEWRDSDGNIEYARFKFDILDHFYPKPSFVIQEKVIAWRRVPPPAIFYNE